MLIGLNDLIDIIKADLFRYDRRTGFSALLRCGYDNPGFKFTFWWRICSFLATKPVLKVIFYYWAKMIYNHYKYKFGIDIPIGLTVWKGLYVGHFGGVVIGADVVIGVNCNLSQGVTIQ